jgi:hypothetical protein
MYLYRCEKHWTQTSVQWVVLCLGRFKILTGAVGLVLESFLMLPCLVPLILRSIRTIMEATIERKTNIMVTNIMML